MVRAGVNLVTRRRVQLGAPRALARRARLRVARRGARPAARARHRGRPRDPHRLAPAVARRSSTPRRSPSTATACGSSPDRATSSRPPRASTASTRSRSRRDLADRYADHPAVRMWHVGNEYGAARLRRRGARASSATGCAAGTARSRPSTTRGDTLVWSQRYRDFDEVLPPRAHAVSGQPGAVARLPPVHVRQLLRCFTEQRDAHPRDGADAARSPRTSWASTRTPTTGRGRAEVDVVADDHYPDHAAPRRRRHGARPGPHALARRRAAVAAHGAGDQRDIVAPAQPAEVARRARLTRCRPSPAAPTAVALLPVAAGPRRRRAVPLGDAPARGRRHRGLRARPRARRRPAPTRAGRGRPGRGIRRRPLRLVVVVGRRGARAADRAARHARRRCAAWLPRAAAAGLAADLVQPGRRPFALPRRARAASYLVEPDAAA